VRGLGGGRVGKIEREVRNVAKRTTLGESSFPAEIEASGSRKQQVIKGK